MRLPTNSDRAGWAYEGIKAFAKACGMDKSGDLAGNPEIVVGDFLCDLMHYCEQNGIKFNEWLKNARGNYRQDLEEERGK